MKFDSLSRSFPTILGSERKGFLVVEKYIARVCLVGLAVLILTLSLLGISGTSAGIYHDYLVEPSEDDPSLLFGRINLYRSDEMRVSTPWTIAQSRVGYPQTNPLFGVSGQMLVFYDVPVKDFTMLFKPHNWAFLILPVENALAFKWWFRASLFLAAAYLIFIRITGNRRFLGILSALALFLSPYLHWYYSATLLDIVTYFFLIFECFSRLVQFKSKQALIGYSAALGYLCVAQILLFYPPTQISIGWAFSIVVLMFLRHERRSFTPARLKQLAAALAGVVVFVALILAVFFIEYGPAVQTITQTVYPGNRVNLRPGHTFQQLLGSFFNLQLQEEGVVVPSLFRSSPNAASGFFLFGVFLLPVLIIFQAWTFWKSRKVDGVTLVLALLFALFLLWDTQGVHPTVAKILLIKSVPTTRVILALGLINFILIFWYLFRFRIPSGPFVWVLSGGAALVVFLYYLKYGLDLRTAYPDFIFSPRKIIAIAGFVAVAYFCLLVQWRGLFILLLAGFSFASVYKVNPLYRGLSELESGPMYEAVHSIVQKDGGKHRWVFFQEKLLENLLQANGANTLNGVYYYPDFEMWKVLDPEGARLDVYNRYSHTLFMMHDSDEVLIELKHTDVLQVTVNPCDEKLVELGVKYQVFPDPVEHECLRQVSGVDYNLRDFYIFERIQ